MLQSLGRAFENTAMKFLVTQKAQIPRLAERILSFSRNASFHLLFRCYTTLHGRTLKETRGWCWSDLTSVKTFLRTIRIDVQVSRRRWQCKDFRIPQRESLMSVPHQKFARTRWIKMAQRLMKHQPRNSKVTRRERERERDVHGWWSTRWNKAILETLIVAQMENKYLPFMKHGRSWPCRQQSTRGSNPDPAEPSPQSQILLKITSLAISRFIWKNNWEIFLVWFSA